MAMECRPPVTADPAEDRSAGLRLTILPDALSVLVTVTGTGPLDPATVESALAEAGVAYGIQDEAIEALCTAEKKQAVVARGDAPQPGQDTRFEPLVAFRRDTGTPKVKANGRVDYLDLGYAKSVRVGEPLMRRIPPTPGLPGRNVRGEVIEGRDGHDRPFRRVGLGTRLSAEDPDLLVAAEAGLPTFGPDYARVDPVLFLPAVDVSTGHIRFAGTVVVAGDVMGGLRIDADRDVIVAGTVEAAEIRAGGNVELRGGMVGQGSGRLEAGGSITARYLDNVAVTAGEDLFFEETISHSQVTVGRDLVAIATNGRGQIIGGRLQAGRQVRVRLLGAPAGTVTPVAVGQVDPTLIGQAQTRLETCRQALLDAMQQVVRLRLDGEDGPALDAARAHCERLQVDFHLAERQWLAVQPAPVQDWQVIAADGFYGGVEVRIGEARRPLREDLPGARLVLQDGQITLRI